MFKAWQFWFTIIGTIASAIMMFSNLRVEVVETKADMFHVKQNVQEIKEDIRDIKDKIFERAAVVR